jgi:hypothetical protein
MSAQISIGRCGLMLLAATCVVLAVNQAQALTIASFADPTVGAPSIAYMVEARNGPPGVISQPANAPTVDLAIDPSLPGGGQYTDVTLSFAPLSYTGNFLAGAMVGGGYFEFIKDNQTLLRIDFDSAFLTRWGIGADDIFNADGVTFTVLGQPIQLESGTGSFAFSFTNQRPVPGAPAPASGFDATAAFTSSGTVVPEPFTLVFLALGTGLMLVRRHR